MRTRPPGGQVPPGTRNGPPRPQERRPRLFREATQLKTVAAVALASEIEPRHVETQVQAADAARGGRPAVTEVADATLHAIRMIAVARGSLQKWSATNKGPQKRPPPKWGLPQKRRPQTKTSRPQKTQKAYKKKGGPREPPDQIASPSKTPPHTSASFKTSSSVVT